MVDHLEILAQGPEAWNAWRRENPDTRPSLIGANLIDANLIGANLIDANLSLAHLSGANLRTADLRGVHLSRAHLIGADLSLAHLIGADLRGANLSLAHLIGAGLRGADLRGTNLRGANLRGADLRGAHLSRANLTHVEMGQTSLGNLDLSKTEGLETIEHLGPSTIGTDTLYKSAGRIPEIFLKGCGVPENLVFHLPSLVAPSAIDFYSCFISYSHDDHSFARRLHDQLQARGIRCWLDEVELRIGDKILPRVMDALRIHDKILLCCSRTSLASAWVDREIELGLQRELEEQRQMFLPLDLDRHLFEDYAGRWRDDLRGRLAGDFLGWESDTAKFKEQLERVVAALQTEANARDKPPSNILAARKSVPRA